MFSVVTKQTGGYLKRHRFRGNLGGSMISTRGWSCIRMHIKKETDQCNSASVQGHSKHGMV